MLTSKQCADITFADNNDPDIPEVNQTNCFNSTGNDHIGFQMVYTTSSPAPLAVAFNPYLSLLAPLVFAAASWITWL